MQISNEIIEVLEYLCGKFGMTIDWTSQNIVPYLEQLCEKFIHWEIATSIAWIVMSILVTIITFIFSKNVDFEGFESCLFWGVVIVTIGVIGVQVFDIIECCTFPEKAIYDYIASYMNTKN